MEEFVCVRVIEGWGMDLSLFQFDWWSTWVVFLMNADQTIYGRYGWKWDNSTAGLRKALEGALELHRNYPANKAELAGKRGLTLEWKTAEILPDIVERGTYRRGGDNRSCLHCHHVQDAVIHSLRDGKRPIPDRYTSDYPNLARMGLTLDPAERATVTEVLADSLWGKAGLRPGDRILRLAGQPLISIADLQWVLFSAEDTATLKAEIDRAGQKVEATVTLPPGWRGR